MDNWRDKISAEIKATINLDSFAKNYLAKINNNLKSGEPLNYAVRHAQSDLRVVLADYGLKMHDIAHLLHFCGMAIFPAMYSGCGCHEHLRK